MTIVEGALLISVVIALLTLCGVANKYLKSKRQIDDLTASNGSLYELLSKTNEAHLNMRLLFDAVPLACHLWDKNKRLFYCNEANVALFGIKDKQQLIDRYNDYSPFFQPDGQMSTELTERMLNKAFEEGRCVYERMYRKSDGKPLPTEVTLVRVAYEDDYVIAGYVRDLKEHKKILGEIEHRDALLDTVNKAAAILLQSEPEEFEKALKDCMEMIAEAVKADRVFIYKNHDEAEGLSCSMQYKWFKCERPGCVDDLVEKLLYREYMPGWAEILSGGKCVNSLTCDMQSKLGAILAAEGVKSLLVVPVLLQGHFWGFISYDDRRQEKLFSANEESILRSGSLLFINALLRNESLLNIRAAAAQLESALEKANSASAAKSNFLANMSHEMRTPMNAIIGLSELMVGEYEEDEALRENLDKIYVAGVTLLSIINDILDISKVESGKFELIPVTYDTPSLINDTITFNIARISDKPIEFRLIVDEAIPCQLFGDDLRIKQICNNLLSNACKYTKKGYIEWSVSCEKDEGGHGIWLVCSVKDTGIGIKQDDVGHLFSDYGQVDTKSNRRIEGTGLGLALSKRMAQMMDGDVTVVSEYGVGSTFTVRMRQTVANEAPIGADVVKSLQSFHYIEGRRARNKMITRLQLPYASVLVVDDVATNLDVARGMMKPYGMRIDCASSGSQAINIVREEKVKYDAIFMDHMMPEMDGVEAVRIIREEIGTDYAKGVPIIALTANAIVGNEDMFLSKGFQAFLSKPIDMLMLDSIIRKWVRDKSKETELPQQEKAGGEVAGAVGAMAGRAEAGAVGATADGVEEPPGGAKAYTGWGETGTIGARAYPGREVAGAGPESLGVDGLLINRGIERFGSEEAYYSVLNSYIMNTPNLLNQIENVTEDTLANYSITIHGIKGSSQSVCANTIGRWAERLERAAKDGDFTYIENNNREFIKSAQELIDKTSVWLQNVLPHGDKPLAFEPDRRVLSLLWSACTEYDIDGVDLAMEELGKYDYEFNSDLFDWLKEEVTILNFKAISEKLEEMAAI